MEGRTNAKKGLHAINIVLQPNWTGGSDQYRQDIYIPGIRVDAAAIIDFDVSAPEVKSAIANIERIVCQPGMINAYSTTQIDVPIPITIRGDWQ